MKESGLSLASSLEGSTTQLAVISVCCCLLLFVFVVLRCAV